jgi:hypothetical protein
VIDLCQVIANPLTAEALGVFDLLDDDALFFGVLCSLLFLLIDLVRLLDELVSHLRKLSNNVSHCLLVKLVAGNEVQVAFLQVRDCVFVEGAYHVPVDFYVLVDVHFALH